MYSYSDTKKDEMDGVRGTYGKKRNTRRYLTQSLKERENVKYLYIHIMIILKLILKKKDAGARSG